MEKDWEYLRVGHIEGIEKNCRLVIGLLKMGGRRCSLVVSMDYVTTDPLQKKMAQK